MALKLTALALVFSVGCLPVPSRHVAVAASDLERLAVQPDAELERDLAGRIVGVRVVSRQRGMMRGANWGAWIGAALGAVASVFIVARIPGNRSGDCPSNQDCDFQRVTTPIIVTGMLGMPLGALIGGAIGAGFGGTVEYTAR